MPLKSQMCSQPQHLPKCYNFPLTSKAMPNNAISEAEVPLILESIWTMHWAVAHKWVLQKAEEIYTGEVCICCPEAAEGKIPNLFCLRRLGPNNQSASRPVAHTSLNSNLKYTTPPHVM
jgi:hypothetical protein